MFPVECDGAGEGLRVGRLRPAPRVTEERLGLRRHGVTDFSGTNALTHEGPPCLCKSREYLRVAPQRKGKATEPYRLPLTATDAALSKKNYGGEGRTEGGNCQ